MYQNHSQKRGTRRAVIALWFLAPLCGEMLSGSSTPIEWLNPFVFILLGMLYGSGALLIRESVRRWGKGWPSILLLGMAYGIYEEGIVVRSFFDPTWGDLDKLAWYGRWLGVNWVWTAGLTVFHATVSTAIPILLVELMYPDLRHKLWLSQRGMKIHGLLFGSMAIIGMGFKMQAPPLAYIGCVVVMVLLVQRARRWSPPDRTQLQVKRLPRPRRIFLFGFLSMVGFLIALWIVPGIEPPALFSFGLFFVFPTLIIWRAKRLGVWAWGPLHQWALAAGALGFWILLALMAVAGPDMPIAGLLSILFLWWLRRRVRRYGVFPPTDAQLAPPPTESYLSLSQGAGA